MHFHIELMDIEVKTKHFIKDFIVSFEINENIWVAILFIEITSKGIHERKVHSLIRILSTALSISQYIHEKNTRYNAIHNLSIEPFL